MNLTRITIIGGGLIGGSLAMALKGKDRARQITLIDLPNRLPEIEEVGIADKVLPIEKLADVLPTSELVVLAAPVRDILDLLERIAPHLREGAIVMDVGSTKSEIVEKAKRVMPDTATFIGGHPIAGSERSGISVADPLLFKDRLFVLCPNPDTPPDQLLSLIHMVEELLAVPLTIEPEEHDRILATVSHAPQILALALMRAAVEDDAAHRLLETVAGPGFLGITRVAASEYEVWRDIIETNKSAILNAITRIEDSLRTMKASLGTDEGKKLWTEISTQRRKMKVDPIRRDRKLDLRALIDLSDERLLRELTNRFQLGQRMGHVKGGHGEQVHDPDRERRLIKDRQELGERLSLPDEFVAKLFDLILEHSRSVQVAKDK